MWFIRGFLVILINVLIFTWLTQIKYKLTLKRRRRWKRLIWFVYFALAPVLLLLYLIHYDYVDYLLVVFSLIGIWFAVSQIHFADRRSGVPQLTRPLASFYGLISLLLLLFSMLAAIQA